MKAIIDVNIKMTEDIEDATLNEKELEAVKSLYWLAFQGMVGKMGASESEVDVVIRLEDDNTKLMHEPAPSVEKPTRENIYGL